MNLKEENSLFRTANSAITAILAAGMTDKSRDARFAQDVIEL
jgi:hypothetical protein